MEQETSPSELGRQQFEDHAFRNLKRRANELIKILVTLGALLLSIGVAYGTLTAKDAELSNRMQAVEQSSKERDQDIKSDLTEIKGQLHKIEEYLRNGSNRPSNQPGGGK